MSATGLVTAAVGLAEGVYPITLRLTDDTDGNLQATRVLRVSVFKNPARTALEMFVAGIASGREWRIDGVPDDWDGDEIPNPYDWTPDSVEVDGVMVEVNLTLNGVDPWPIYNVWQLQAIDGMSVSEGGEVTANSGLFGGSRLSRKYRLALDIDATPTRDWNDGGFRPIGVDRPGNNNADRFVRISGRRGIRDSRSFGERKPPTVMPGCFRSLAQAGRWRRCIFRICL